MQFSSDKTKPKAMSCPVKNLASREFCIIHEFSFNFIPELKHVYYHIIMIFKNIRDFRFEMCSAEYGVRITLLFAIFRDAI